MQNIKYLFHSIAVASFIIIIFVGFVFDETPENWEHGYETGVVLFALSTSFLAAYFFYLMDIFFPTKIKKNQITKRLEVPMNRVLNFMNFSVSCIANITSLKYSEITKENLLNNMDESWDIIAKNSPMLSPDLKTKLSYLDYFDHNILDIEDYINRINSLPEIDFELQLLMDEVIYSQFHTNIKYIKNMNKLYPGYHYSTDFIISSFEEYTTTLFKVKNYMEKNKVPITIGTTDFN